jgi:hypothetical protein
MLYEGGALMRPDDTFEGQADQVEATLLKKFSSLDLVMVQRRIWLDSSFLYFRLKLISPSSGNLELLVEAARIPEDEFPERLSISVTALTKGGVFLLQALHGAPRDDRHSVTEFVEKIVTEQTLVIASFQNGRWSGSRTADAARLSANSFASLTDEEVVRSWTGKFDRN